ncbi:ribonuclease III [Aestuariimicrobium soli]|uniref:ribonuclease III n=1 Tax=Aestuariimicrobium soli TaxID=2035834 RepID=UPI003EB70648
MDAQLFELALTHRSWAYEHGGVANNERLEFLGDAVLGVVVTEHLYEAYPDEPEGRLAKIRAATVNANTLADVARELELGALIKLGKGEIATGGHDKTSILADTMEALIGAARLSGTRESAETLVRHLFVPITTQASTLGAGLDWKTSLQELAAKDGWTVQYAVTESGPDHDRRYEAAAVINDVTHPSAQGRSKREAEIGAARLAYQALSG